jgi:hypothetical protein
VENAGRIGGADRRPVRSFRHAASMTTQQRKGSNSGQLSTSPPSTPPTVFEITASSNSPIAGSPVHENAMVPQ